jgi:CheY-like chemotaxis protein
MTPPVTLPDTLRGTASPRRQGAIHRLDHVRILVVDDDELACEGTVQILREYGADAHAVRSASLALDVLEQRPGEQTSPFDVLISDIGMPGQTGYELIRRVRAHHDPRVSGIRAAAVTAYARSEDRIRALEAGYQVHIAKPLEEHELTTVIAALIGKI